MAMKPAVFVNQILWSAVQEIIVTQITIWQLVMKDRNNLTTKLLIVLFK
jgi:hypothetical protein